MDKKRKDYTDLLEIIVETNTISYLLDRLISACIKLAKFDWLRQEEQSKNNPDAARISILMEKSRLANEERHALCNAFDAKIKICIEKGEYKFMKDVRTFETLK
jgi:hypothetical protein